MQQRQRQLVDAHVVVFPVAARRLQWPRIALAAAGGPRIVRHDAPAVHRVGHAEAAALPLAGLLEQVTPGHRAVVRRVEADAGQARHHRFVHVGQQTVAMRHAGQHREVGLGDAEGQVGTIGLAPGGDLAAVLQHDAGDATARVHRPAQAVERRRIVVVHAPGSRVGGRVARPGHLVCGCEVNRIGPGVGRVHGPHCTHCTAGPLPTLPLGGRSR